MSPAVVKAPDGSLAIKAEESGFDGGIVTVIVGMDANGTETGIWVDASTRPRASAVPWPKTIS